MTMATLAPESRACPCGRLASDFLTLAGEGGGIERGGRSAKGCKEGSGSGSGSGGGDSKDRKSRALAASVLPYTECCGRYLDHWSTTPAPDAHSLMRSRYTAFVLEHAAYLQATWHPSTRPSTLDFEPGTRWLGLEVRAHRQIDSEHAEVEFVARQRSAGGKALRLHERSRFVRTDGRWFYVDGDLT